MVPGLIIIIIIIITVRALLHGAVDRSNQIKINSNSINFPPTHNCRATEFNSKQSLSVIITQLPAGWLRFQPSQAMMQIAGAGGANILPNQLKYVRRDPNAIIHKFQLNAPFLLLLLIEVACWRWHSWCFTIECGVSALPSCNVAVTVPPPFHNDDNST